MEGLRYRKSSKPLKPSEVAFWSDGRPCVVQSGEGESMSYHEGLCMHGNAVTKTEEKDDQGRTWTVERRPKGCRLCAQAIEAGASPILTRYIVGDP
jgi:hypothetical protein